MKKIQHLILFGIASILPLSVNAASEKLELNCPETGTPGSTIACSISMEPKTITSVKRISAKYDLGGLILENYTKGSSFDLPAVIDDYGFLQESNTALTGIITVGTLQLKLPEDSVGKTYTVTLNSIEANPIISSLDGNGNVFSTTTTPVTIKSVSDVRTLSSISVDTGTVEFNADTKEYELTVAASKITINAIATDSNAKVEGTGTKSLSYGLNTFPIVVTSEAGKTTTYTLNITRVEGKNTNNYLNKLIIDGQKIDFDKDKNDYELVVDNSVDSLNLLYSLSASASKVSVKTNDSVKVSSENATINISNLQVGKNLISLIVTSESGVDRTYNITVERKETASSTTTNPDTGVFGGISAVVIILIAGVTGYIVVRKKSKFSQI